MMDESPFSMVGFKPFLTFQKMEVVVADEARTQPQKHTVHVITIKVDQSLNQLCPL